MQLVHPKNYGKLTVGEIFMFECMGTPGKFVEGKLLYAQNRKNFLYDENGLVTKEYIFVAHRTGYIPIKQETIKYGDQDIIICSQHLEVGFFKIYKLSQ